MIVDKLIPFEYGETYHVFNKSVGGVLLFKTSDDYFYFLKKTERYILPIADIYAYCLIPNHFHFLLKIKEFDKQINNQKKEHDTQWLTKTFSNFFASYSRSCNNIYKRQGRLFLQAFKRIKVEDMGYFTELVAYIHRNPIHHGIVSDFSKWKYSSYNSYLSKKESNIDRQEVMSYFDSLEDFVEFHNNTKKEYEYRKYYLE